MELSDFKVGNTYTQKDLIEAFGGSFLRPRGITPINSKNIIILISYHYGRNRYEDKLFENDIMYYSGEGTAEDQKLTGRNKSIYEAKEKGKKLLLFVVLKRGEYKYFGEVEVVGALEYKTIVGDEGKSIKAIRFPLMQKTAVRRLTEYEMRHIVVSGITPIEKPVIQVVGAAIINDENEILCAQRGYGSLIGKWEFPGGKVEKGETDQQALKREIKEELGIDVEVQEFIDESYTEYKDKNINLKVYKCKHLSGDINDTEHQSLKWMKSEELESLDWAEADIPIMESYLDSLPDKIDGQVDYDYFEAEAIKPSNKDLKRVAQDYEKSQRAKQKSGESAEKAVIHYERDKLNNAGHPELAELVVQESHNNSAAGYDVKSYEINDDGSFSEVHIEVKVAAKTSKYIEFFISDNELDKFKNDQQHRIYCLIKRGRSYKLHIVNKCDFFKHEEYVRPIAYRVKIRIAE